MQKIISTLFISFCIAFGVFGQTTHVIFDTTLGEVEVELFDDTPQHRDLFLQAVKDSVYHQALFNRVIAGFVNQGGELDEPILQEEAEGLRERERLPAEILPQHYHYKGALGAGRDDNPEKASYLAQIYFVIGKVMTNAELDALEKAKSIKIPAKHREIYTSIGGIPRLDGDYTIFGKTVRGLNVMEQINQVNTDSSDVPLKPVVFSVRVLGEAKH
ncbi:peptidylprolyl isomerase [Sphingobacterium chungjuense]|uniref:peptidylprolyl isomerase n=1 Tax=Sphingobacterium chungjuense TaxID=2675553 RepID=UPI0014072A3B|nr:peptidylprolyl isomerase [Sphingobacterium chungjuense]